MTFCSRAPVPPPADTREPIDVAYVTGPELRVHAQPNDASPVIVKYENGESISIMSKRGDWVEVRTGDRTGWSHTGDLGTGAQAKEQQDNPSPRFRRASPPYNPESANQDSKMARAVASTVSFIRWFSSILSSRAPRIRAILRCSGSGGTRSLIWRSWPRLNPGTELPMAWPRISPDTRGLEKT